MVAASKRREQKRLAAVRWRERHREVARARGRANYRKHAQARLDYAVKKRAAEPQFYTITRAIAKHGLTLDQFHAMYEAQDFSCAICRETLTGRRALHLDHDHATNRVRGLLCLACNIGLGMFRDHPERLTAAVAYLA